MRNIKRKIGAIIIAEIFLLNEIGFSINVVSGYLPFQESDDQNIPACSPQGSDSQDILLPPLMSLAPEEVQNPSQTIDPGPRYYPTFAIQPESNIELVKIIEPSFLPRMEWLSSTIGHQNSEEVTELVNSTAFMRLLETGKLWFTMNKELIPIYFYDLSHEGMDITAVTEWKYEGNSLTSLPDLLKEELREIGVLTAGYNVKVESRDFKIEDVKTGESIIITQKRTVVKKGDIQCEIIEYDFEDGENIYLAVTQNETTGTITSSIIQGNVGNVFYSTPLYTFERLNFQLANKPVEVGKESGYHLNLYKRTSLGESKLGELDIDNVVVYKRHGEEGAVKSMQYRVKTGENIYLQGEEIPIEGVIEYRDVILDTEFSIPFSYRIASYTPGDIGLNTAGYYRKLGPAEEVYCEFPVEGIKVKDGEPAKLIYVRHYNGWDVVISNEVKKTYSEIQSLTPEEIKSLLISEGSEIKLAKNAHSNYFDLRYTIKNDGGSFNISKEFYDDIVLDKDGDLQSYVHKKIDYRLSSLPLNFLQSLFYADIDSEIDDLESQLTTGTKQRYYEEKKRRTEFVSGDEKYASNEVENYLVDFTTGETTVSKKKITFQKQTDSDITSLLGYTPQEIESMIWKYKEVPQVMGESYDYSGLTTSNLIWVQKCRINSDGFIGNVFDYRNGENTVTIYQKQGESLSYRKYSGEMASRSTAGSLTILSPDSIASSPDCMGVANYDSNANIFTKEWEVKKEDSDKYGYYMLPVENLQQSAYHLYKLLQYTGQLDKFLSGETVEVNLVKKLNEMAEEMGAGKNEASSFISSLNNYWLQYRRMLLLEASSIGAKIIDNCDGSESCDYVVKLQLPKGSFNTPVKKRDITVNVSENVITIVENHPQLGTISRKAEIILEDGSKIPSASEKFDLLYNFYLCESNMDFRNLHSEYLKDYQIKEINIYDSTGVKRISMFFQDGKLQRVEYPNPVSASSTFWRSGGFIPSSPQDVQNPSRTIASTLARDELSPALAYEKGKLVIPEKRYWNGDTASAKVNGLLRGLDGLLKDFLGKYGKNIEAAIREGKIRIEFGGVEISLGEDLESSIYISTPQSIQIYHNGYTFNFSVTPQGTDNYKVQVIFASPNEEFISEPWEVNYYVLKTCYPFLAHGLNGEEMTPEMIVDILTELKNKLSTEIGVPGGEYIKYPSDDYFKLISSTSQNMTSMLEDKFFTKVRDFLYYYSLGKVCDQILNGEDEWITPPSTGNVTDILASYPLVGFERLNDLIISAVGRDENGGHTAFSVDASKLYFARSIVMYDKYSGIGYLTHQYYAKREFEFGDDKEAFGNWVRNMLGDKATDEDIDTLWSMYQLAKTKKNIGIFYYYCRGAFIDGDQAELEKLRVASESEEALKAIYGIMQDPVVLNQAGIDFRNRYKEYFKYLTLPDYGDKWAPVDNQIVLEPNRVNITWETIGAVAATFAVWLIDRTGILGPLLARLDALKESGKVMGWLGKFLGWGIQTAVGSVRGASVFSVIYGLPMLMGQTGEADFIQWLNTLGQNFLTGLVYSALFGIMFTPAQFGIEDMPPLIGLVGRPIEKILQWGANRVSSPLVANTFKGTAWVLNRLLTYGNRLEAAVIGRYPGSEQVRATITNWRYIGWFYPTEVMMEEMVLPQAMELMTKQGSRGLLFHEAPMLRTFRALAIGNLRNTETAGSMAEMTDPLENPLGFILLPGIISVFQQYGIGGVLGLQVPTD